MWRTHTEMYKFNETIMTHMRQEVFSPLGLRMITEFMKRGNERVHGRELARLLGANQRTVQRYLVMMEKEGVLLRAASGRNQLYEMDLKGCSAGYLTRAAECYASVSFLDRDFEVASIMRELVSVVPDPIIIFGSTVKGYATEHSDIDLLVLGEDTHDIGNVEDKYVKQVHMICFATSRFEEMVSAGDPFAMDVLHDHIAIRGIDYIVELWWRIHGQD